MANKVTIVDYGSGNLLSVTRAFEHCGADTILTSDPDRVEQADYLVLPGVGAFESAMTSLRERQLIEPILNFTRTERPFLGICLGMQVMLDDSTEFGMHDGLGILPGSVKPVPDTDSKGEPHPVPHIGWNELTNGNSDWRGTILDSLRNNDEAVYFVHSFAAYPANTDNILASCLYNGREITAVIRHENLYGCQFHPEKSGSAGLKIIRNFMNTA